MTFSPLPERPPKPSSENAQVSLVINLQAMPSVRLSHEISTILKRMLGQPYTFLGSVDETFSLDLRLIDPGHVASELLARRLLKIKGVQRLTAQRVCARRGLIYAISLKAFSPELL